MNKELTKRKDVVPGPPSRLTKTTKMIRRCAMLYVMILPAVVAMAIFHYYPIYGIQIAFKNYRNNLGIWGREWVGLKWFKKFWDYPYFWKMIRNTLWISVRGLLNFPLPIIFAIMLHEMKTPKLKRVCQQLTYAPYFISVVVLCSMITAFVRLEGGLINIIIEKFGGEAINFLALPKAFPEIMAISGLWQGLGWSTIIYLATLSGVSPELVEAAEIDGASRMQVIWHVYIPHILPTVITLFILNMGSLLSVGFDKVFLLQNALNKESSSIIATYTYEIGLLKAEYSYSTAIGLFNSLVNIVVISTFNFISKKVTKISMW